MSTFREMVYMVLDQNKLSGDDAYVEPEHVLFILSKVRAYLITQKYQKLKSQIGNANFQTLHFKLEPVENLAVCLNGHDTYLMKSTTTVPDLLLTSDYEGYTEIMPKNIFGAPVNFTFVNNIRFNSVGYNRFMQNHNYVTIGPDNYIYVKSHNEDILLLEELTLRAVFEDIESAALLSANTNECGEQIQCDILDLKFPLEEGLVTPLLETTGNYIYQMSSQSKDVRNNAADDLSSIQNYLNAIIKERYRDNNGV